MEACGSNGSRWTFVKVLTPLELQSRLGDNSLKLYQVSNLSPKRDCGPKRVKTASTGRGRESFGWWR